MKSIPKNTGIILSITIICLVVILSVFDLWTIFGIDKFLQKAAIVFAGVLGVIIARLPISLFIEMIKWIKRKTKKSNA